ncbi:tRNA (adenosine(37)-N6)-threonylcarbamoyltransferase complex transferase subunit TsaD [Candidatus Kaiserbacteria bacterium]|nr:tRNA (adenosine(37)-N6)-threonylcarbamoyltransferase complex transferase subunit TsaD [Candidatus Kaiserbacteria bacterium]
MRILAIETSCDETAIAILDCEGDEQSARFCVLGNALLSQVEIHKEYGGVFPSLAKREHAKNLMPLLEAALEEAELLHEGAQVIPDETRAKISEILAREPGLTEAFLEFVSECEPPEIDAIAVTAGPGLEPALWVGINFAKALSLMWGKPLIAVNHMEGHVLAALASRKQEQEAGLEIKDIKTPVLALLISGGHTELVLMKKWLEYELIGQTRDDAVGEAFDKVARMLELPYPGGPEISKLAELSRFDLTSDSQGRTLEFNLPRPMIDSSTCDFSFAGLKTAVLYLLKTKPDVSEREKRHIAHEFENAVADVLWKKTSQALEQTGAHTLVIGGGVSANIHIRRVFQENMASKFPDSSLKIPASNLTTDNAVMIALAGFYRARRKSPPAGGSQTDIIARGNLSLA